MYSLKVIRTGFLMLYTNPPGHHSLQNSFRRPQCFARMLVGTRMNLGYTMNVFTLCKCVAGKV